MNETEKKRIEINIEFDSPESANQQLFIQLFEYFSKLAHDNARKKGFWKASDALLVAAMKIGMDEELLQMRKSQLRDLMHSELGEACEGDRKNLKSDKIPGFSNVEEEYADLIIRLMDASEGLNLRLAEAVIAKMDYNLARPAMHGGKKF